MCQYVIKMWSLNVRNEAPPPPLNSLRCSTRVLSNHRRRRGWKVMMSLKEDQSGFRQWEMTKRKWSNVTFLFVSSSWWKRFHSAQTAVIRQLCNNHGRSAWEHESIIYTMFLEETLKEYSLVSLTTIYSSVGVTVAVQIHDFSSFSSNHRLNKSRAVLYLSVWLSSGPSWRTAAQHLAQWSSSPGKPTHTHAHSENIASCWSI